MQIQSLKVVNMIGARRADVELTTPVTLFCGPNGACKSSIQESIRMAFTGKTLRVALKKEYPLMVSEGAKTGKATVVTDIGTASFELPSGTHTLEGDLKLGLPDALEYVLNAQAFASMTPEARRTFLFALTGCNVTKKEVKRRLLEKECVEAKVDMTLPLMHSGFPAAAEFAAKKATESKGAWRGLTGEAWGSKKAEGWEAEKPEYDQDALAAAESALTAIDEQGAALHQAFGALQAKQRNAAAGEQERANNLALAAKITRLRDKLAIDEASLADYEAAVAELASKAGTGKKEGLVHDLARFLDGVNFGDDGDPDAAALIARYVTEHGPINGSGDPDAARKLPAHVQSRDLMKKSVDNDRRDIAGAEAAQAWIDNHPAEGDKVSQAGELDALQTKIAELRTSRAAAVQAGAELKAAAERATSADSKTKDAAAHHIDTMAWLAIAEHLAPDGIPAEMLAQALRPINVTMKESSVNTGWRQPNIGADMSITADGRPYDLLSKSEKWRVDAIIAVAIAQLSEVRILMLDEVDILEPAARGELLYWMDDLAAAGALNNALLFATMKQQPTGLPENIRAIWLQNGVIPEYEEQAEAA